MNHAYVDASWRESSAGLGEGGWGLVLLDGGQLPRRMGEYLQAPDNNAAEMRAVLEAVRCAPAGEALSVYSDNWAVLSAIGKGKGPETLQPLRSEVLALAQDKDMALRVAYAERTRRHMRYAHDLANAARRGEWREREQLLYQPAEISLELREGGTLARLALRRSGERVTAEVPLSPLDTLPPSAQALLAAVKLAQSGETLRVRRASKLARALWDNPQRSLLPEAQAKL